MKESRKRLSLCATGSASAGRTPALASAHTGSQWPRAAHTGRASGTRGGTRTRATHCLGRFDAVGHFVDHLLVTLNDPPRRGSRAEEIAQHAVERFHLAAAAASENIDEARSRCSG